MAKRLGPAGPLTITWKGAGAWLIFRARQVNFLDALPMTKEKMIAA
jgi:hypothetical protein